MFEGQGQKKNKSREGHQCAAHHDIFIVKRGHFTTLQDTYPHV